MSKKTWLSPILKALLPLALALLVPTYMAGQDRPQPKRFSKDSKRLAEKKKQAAAASDTIPLYGGTYVGVDLYGIGAPLLGSDTKSSEVQVDVNLKNRFFPVAEIGYAVTDMVSEYGSRYQSRGTYFRLGLNYKIKYKNPSESHIFVGLRYGWSPFKYDVESIPISDALFGEGPSNPNLSDDIWGGSVPFRVEGASGTAHWGEIVFGLRAQVWKNFLMGWSLRYKMRFGYSGQDNAIPSYIPGFGENDTSAIGITYSLIYKLPL
ncbi:MAG: DUF6048 family protein [Bacteroidaceae bacterium]|jgi:hypothetical protein